jgi:hypothetical protein
VTKREKGEKRAVYDRITRVVAEAEELMARYPDPEKAPPDVMVRLRALRDYLGLLNPET